MSDLVNTSNFDIDPSVIEYSINKEKEVPNSRRIRNGSNVPKFPSSLFLFHVSFSSIIIHLSWTVYWIRITQRKRIQWTLFSFHQKKETPILLLLFLLLFLFLLSAVVVVLLFRLNKPNQPTNDRMNETTDVQIKCNAVTNFYYYYTLILIHLHTLAYSRILRRRLIPIRRKLNLKFFELKFFYFIFFWNLKHRKRGLIKRRRGWWRTRRIIKTVNTHGIIIIFI